MKSAEIRKWLVHSGVLNRVAKPSRYIGHELNAVHKKGEDLVSFLLAFPDIYEVGMSHLGLKVMYSAINSIGWAKAERTYLPWKDMILEMNNKGVPLYSVESFSPASDFDVIGITLQYELSYTSALALIELSKTPLLQDQRKDNDPLVIGGGPCTANPEPMSRFFDALVIGEGETAIQEIARIIRSAKRSSRRTGRETLLKEISAVRGVYVPSLGKKKVTRAVAATLDESFSQASSIVPFTNIVHNRAVIEVMRGCTRGCRFCQAGMIYRPVRELGLEEASNAATQLIATTGFEEMSLLLLSSTDYSHIDELTRELLPAMKDEQVAFSLPSSRIDAFGVDLASRISSIRKTGLTFAPEAGSERLRRVINKNVDENDLMRTVESAKQNGWRRVKLYFMIGLPTETDYDLREIVRLARTVRHMGIKQLSVSVAIFVPKPHTPFQFCKQVSVDEAEEKAKKLYDIRRYGFLQVHDPKKSLLEGVLSRGDNRLGEVVLRAFGNGAVFDEWHEEFDYGKWEEAFAETDVSPLEYMRSRSVEEELPWDHIEMGVSKDFLVREYHKALRGETTEDCRWSRCSQCGVTSLPEVKHEKTGCSAGAHLQK